MGFVGNEFNFTGCCWCSVSSLLISVLRTYLQQDIYTAAFGKAKSLLELRSKICAEY